MRQARNAIVILMIVAQVPYLAIQPGSTAQSLTAQIQVLDRDGTALSGLIDGDAVRLRITLSAKIDQAAPVSFNLDGSEQPVAACTVPAGQTACDTQPFAALGWYWAKGGLPSATRTVQARVDGAPLAETVSVEVAPRPAVMVHGFGSDWQAWVDYLGPDGYLASQGLRGFAVGDGQVEGTMNTGRLDDPAGKTNTIAENAAILGAYIDRVKKATGAQMVDLIAHSMGGLISRYYIDRVMGERDVAQLIMLGSPMAGTDCANLPAALGYYLPAVLEIRPSYVRSVFNQQITHRHGIQFYVLAGTQILDAISAPCTEAPTDIAVSFASATAIQLQASRLPLLHSDLNHSEQAFNDFVRPLLEKPPEEFAFQEDPPLPAAAAPPLQFTRVFTGHLEAGSSQEVSIQIDAGVTVASFALYDTTRTLSVTVRGASGQAIDLSPEKNGLIVVNDPATLVYLGYGFNNPKPGVWKVTLQTTDQTPASGADYALSAQYVGGATLDAAADTLLPQIDQAVSLTASIKDLAGQALTLDTAQAVVHRPDGTSETVPLAIVDSQASASWAPAEAGLYGLDIQVTGRAPDGTALERTAFLAVEAQPSSPSTRWLLPAAVLAGAVLAGAVLFGLLVVVWFVRRRARSR